MNNKIKHLEMIQNIISRMSKNSFMVKGWSLTLASLLIAFGTQLQIGILCPILFVPIILFACLDSYYLQQERKFRELYEIVRLKDDTLIDFDMHFTNDINSKVNYLSCIFSKSILLFYIPILIVLVAVVVILFV